MKMHRYIKYVSFRNLFRPWWQLVPGSILLLPGPINPMCKARLEVGGQGGTFEMAGNELQHVSKIQAIVRT